MPKHHQIALAAANPSLAEKRKLGIAHKIAKLKMTGASKTSEVIRLSGNVAYQYQAMFCRVQILNAVMLRCT
jgi:hypothetical protein